MSARKKQPPKRAAQPETVVIAVTSDHHCGSTLGVCPPLIRLDEGGEYHHNEMQAWLWECWNTYWARVAEVRAAEHAALYQIFNGDLVDGQVKGSLQILSGNPNAQAAVWNACVAVPLSLQPDKLFFVRGTGAHTGLSASSEERIADGLRRDKRPVQSDPRTKTASWWHLRMEVGGVYLDVAHHGRTGLREHTRGSAAVLHVHDIILSYAKRRKRVPDLCIRAHHHKFNDSGAAGKVSRVITSGAWQLATEYVHKVATDSFADVGGFIIVIKNGEYRIETVDFPPLDDPVWNEDGR